MPEPREPDPIERYRAFIALSQEGIWRLELDQPLPADWDEERQLAHLLQHASLAECNAAMARMYGLTEPSDLAGVRLGEFVEADKERYLAALRQFIRADYRLSGIETLERGRDGQLRAFINSLIGVVEGGRLIRVWGTQVDVTENRRLAEELRQSRTMEAVGRLAGGIAHDFNNLLTTILACSEFLLEQLEPAHAGRVEAEEIRAAGLRAADLTRQLLAFSRQQVLAATVIDLNQVVAGMDRLLRGVLGHAVEIETRLRAPQASVIAERGQVEQVIMNLAVNARDAMPEGGRLVLGTELVEPADPISHSQGSVPAGRYVLLTVTDTGSGMPPETLARIFEPFFSTKPWGRGTGMGLATVYGIVQQSGGSIAADSELGRGTTFRIWFPAAQA